MGESTGISWCHHTFNPWIGCTKVSPACDNCYAADYGHRFGVEWGPGKERRRTAAANWKQPLAWDRKAAREGTRPRVFCASLADIFDQEIPDEWRHEVMALIQATPNLIWLLLTKRPKAMADWSIEHGLPDNVWAGTTAENQPMADLRVRELLRTRAKKRFLSMEPLLELVDLSEWLDLYQHEEDGQWMPRNIGQAADTIDWIIAGGESGPNARPSHPDWFRSLRDQCVAAGLAFHFKQWGEWTPGENVPPEVGGTRRHAHWRDTEWSFGETNMNDPEDGWMDEPHVYRVGTSNSGRLLDGRTWDEFPAGC